MPYIQDRVKPIVKPATEQPSDPAHSAAFIFLHGLGDDGAGWEDVANQFQKANKLPYMQWIFPNALENKDARQTAWYRPTSLAPVPKGWPELADEEDEEGLKESIEYVVSVIDDVCSRGVPPNRIVLGGFSQGCALSLLTELTSRYSGHLAGIVGLMGYLPVPERIQQLRTEAGLPHIVGEIPMFLARGDQDRLVPKSKWDESVAKLRNLETSEAAMDIHNYEGVGHEITPKVLEDLNVWLDRVVPKLDP